MKIEILGMQCPECDRTVENVRQAVAELGLEADVVKVEDPLVIASYGLLFPPVLVIDGKVRLSGRVPKLKHLKVWLTEQT
jgi:small redox-active disulfide protein 2